MLNIYKFDEDDRKLYDLCRRYKFEYNTLQEMIDADKRYRSVWSGKLVSDKRKCLRELEKSMLFEILPNFIEINEFTKDNILTISRDGVFIAHNMLSDLFVDFVKYQQEKMGVNK